MQLLRYIEPEEVEIQQASLEVAVSEGTRTANECYDCGHSWFPRSRLVSLICPSCRSANIGLLTEPEPDLFTYRGRRSLSDEANQPVIAATVETRRNTWWRWLLVLPFALLGYTIAQVVVIIVTIPIPWDEASQLFSAFTTSAGFVFLGALIAPAKRTRVAVILCVIMLVLVGMVWGVSLFSGWYDTKEKAFDSFGYLLSIIGSLIGLYFVYTVDKVLRNQTGFAGSTRAGIGLVLLGILSASKLVVGILIFASIATAIWWPIIKTIIGSPLWVFLLVPLGFLLSGFAFFIQSFIYNILAFPMVLLANWLLREQGANIVDDL